MLTESTYVELTWFATFLVFSISGGFLLNILWKILISTFNELPLDSKFRKFLEKIFFCFF
jgi:hypothetical protein